MSLTYSDSLIVSSPLSPHQSLHFFYGLGALVSPVIAEPFLRSACTDGHFQSNIFGWTLENSTLEGLMEYNIDGLQVNMTALNETMSQASRHYHTKPFVQYAYWLIALLQVRMPVFLSVCLTVYCLGLFVSRHYYQVPCTVCLPRPIALHLQIVYFTNIIQRLNVRREIARCECRSKYCKVKCIV